MTELKCVGVGVLIYLAIGIVHCLLAAHSMRRKAAFAKHAPSMDYHEFVLVMLVWPLLALAALSDWLDRRRPL